MVNQQFFGNILPDTVLFNRFELIRSLSSGQIGGVYLCRDKRRDNRMVALKVLYTPALFEPHLREAFQREVRMLRSVSHANVIRGEEYFSDNDFTAFTMEYLDGGTLRDFIVKNPKPALAEIASILKQLAHGILAIHKLGIIHRDLKPENILVDSTGLLKIADFGIAVTYEALSHSSSSHSVVKDQIVGTINYLSPEYVERGEFDQRSDIYAFGVIAYELMTGKLPFYGDSLIDTLTSRVKFDPISPREVRSEIPRVLSDLALRCMKRRPAQRYLTMHEVIKQLEIAESIMNAPESKVAASTDSGAFRALFSPLQFGTT